MRYMSAETKHTPEPWAAYENDSEGIHILGSDFADLSRIVCEQIASSQDAERIVACVNAMAGIEDPATFVDTLREMLHEHCCTTDIVEMERWATLFTMMGGDPRTVAP